MYVCRIYVYVCLYMEVWNVHCWMLMFSEWTTEHIQPRNMQCISVHYKNTYEWVYVRMLLYLCMIYSDLYLQLPILFCYGKWDLPDVRICHVVYFYTLNEIFTAIFFELLFFFAPFCCCCRFFYFLRIFYFYLTFRTWELKD